MLKRGQATILIILGLLVVASVFTVYFFRDQILQSDWETSRALSLSVPEEAEEVHAYLSSCVQDVVTEPVLLLGQQGGYIEIPDDPIGEGDHNIFSNALEIFSDTDFQTAYWYYVAANGVDQTQVPTVEEMESELGTYVSTNIGECADNFTIYEEYNASVGSVYTEVEILDDEVLFTVFYPVHIELEEFSFDFDAFYESVEVPLGRMYEGAVEIMEAENEDYFLEELAYDAFVLNEEVPLAWADFQCEDESWNLEDVEQDMKEILMHNFFAIKVRGTEYSISEESDEDYFEYSLLDDTSGDNLHVNMWYSENWPLSLKAYPVEDGEIVEDSLTGAGFGGVLQSFFCMTSYNVIYDLEFPVLISLTDEVSGYTFQFATMAVLDNNQPRENEALDLDLSEIGEPICDDVSSELTVYAMGVRDTGDLYELEDVEITFQCITSNCDIGDTVGRAGDAELIAYVPQCVNAQIIASKEGFADGIETVTTLEDASVTLTLEEISELSYEIILVDLEGNEREPGDDDTVFVSLTDEDTGYAASVSYPPTADTIALVPGTYQVDGQLVSDIPFDISIDASSYSKCTDFSLLSIIGSFTNTDCTSVDISETELDSAIAGGLSLTWTPDREDLASAEHVIFYVTEIGQSESEEDVEDIIAYLDLGIGYVEPELE